MFKKIALSFLLITGIAVCAYFAYSHLFRPLIFAKSISGLDIPMNSKVVKFKERWSDFNGDGYALAELVADDAYFLELVKQCELSNYHVLPVNQDQAGFSDENFDKLISKDDVGFYNITRSEDDFSVTIVNINNHVITTYTSVQ